MTEIMGCPRCPLYLSDSPVVSFGGKTHCGLRLRWRVRPDGPPSLSSEDALINKVNNVCQSWVPERSEIERFPAPSVATSRGPRSPDG